MATIQLKRGTRAQIDTAMAASQLAAGEPYLVTDERCLAVGTGTNAYALAGKPTIDQIAGINPTLDLDFANQVYRHYSPATGLREKALSDIVTFTRASTATYFDAKGVMQTAASGEPRIDFDPETGECKGLLIEESRTNFLTYSQEFGNSIWVKTNMTTTANAAIALDGTLTAYKIISASDAIGILSRTISFTAATIVTISCYAKRGELSSFFFLMTNAAFGGGGNRTCLFNLGEGSVTQDQDGDVGIVGSIKDVGNGWYRCVVVVTPTVSGDRAVQFVRHPELGDGTSGIYIWGAQFEAGSFPTSYIPTTTATATRAADVAVISGTAFSDFYSASGTLFASYADSGVMSDLSPSLSTLDLADYIDDSSQVNDRLKRLSFFAREPSSTTIEQIEAVL
jgi:hypothetical protein